MSKPVQYIVILFLLFIALLIYIGILTSYPNFFIILSILSIIGLIGFSIYKFSENKTFFTKKKIIILISIFFLSLFNISVTSNEIQRLKQIKREELQAKKEQQEEQRKEQEKQNKFNSLVEKANYNFNNKNYDISYQLFQDAIKLNSLSQKDKIIYSKILFIQGNKYYNNDNNKAEDLFNQSINFDKNNQDSQKYLSLIKNNKEIISLKEMLLREIKSFNKPFNNEPYRTDLKALTFENVLFGAWAKTIFDSRKTNNPELIKLSNILEGKVLKLQQIEYPKMREEYSKILKDKLWIEDMKIELNTYNFPNDRLDLIHYSYASNKNIDSSYKIINEQLQMMRFKVVCFYWFKGAEEKNCYDLDSFNDNELGTVIKQ